MIPRSEAKAVEVHISGCSGERRRCEGTARWLRGRRSAGELRPELAFYYGSIQSLTDQGVVACQACALVEPAGSSLLAASPLEPVGGVAGWSRVAKGFGEQALDLADGERDETGVGRRRGVRPGWREVPGRRTAGDLWRAGSGGRDVHLRRVGYSDFGFCKSGQRRRRQHRNLSPHPGALDAGSPGDGSRAEVTAHIAHAGRPEASLIHGQAYGPALLVKSAAPSA